MMLHYILIFGIFTSTGPAVTTVVQPFLTKTECMAAGKKAADDIGGFGIGFRYSCVEISK